MDLLGFVLHFFLTILHAFFKLFAVLLHAITHTLHPYSKSRLSFGTSIPHGLMHTPHTITTVQTMAVIFDALPKIELRSCFRGDTDLKIRKSKCHRHGTPHERAREEIGNKTLSFIHNKRRERSKVSGQQ